MKKTLLIIKISAVIFIASLILSIMSSIYSWENISSFFYWCNSVSFSVLIVCDNRYRQEKEGERITLSTKEKLFVSALLFALVAVSVLIKLFVHDFTIVIACLMPLWIVTIVYILYYESTRTSK